MSNDQSDQKTVSVRNRNSTVGYPAVAVRMIKVGHTNDRGQNAKKNTVIYGIQQVKYKAPGTV